VRRSRGSRRLVTRLAVVAAAAAAAAVAMAVLAALAAEPRASVIDGFQPSAPAGDVVVVALDSEFTTRAERDPLGAFTPLVTQLSAAGASAIVVEPDVIKLAQAGLAVFGEGLSQAQFDAGLQALEVAVTASVVGDLQRTDGGPPRLARPVPRSTVATSSIATGFATPIPVDVRGPQRTLPLVASLPGVADADVVVPSLALAGVLVAEGTESGEVVRREGERLVAGGHRVLVEDGGYLRVGFARDLLPGGTSVVSGSALADGQVESALLRDRLVFVGVTDPLHAQLFPAATGTTAQLPVVYADANAANTILAGSFMSAPSLRDGVVLGVVVGALVGLLVLVMPLWVAPGIVALGVVGLWYLERTRIATGVPFDLVLAWAGVVSAGTFAVVWRVVEVAQSRRKTSALFASYVPDEVAKQLLDDDIDARRSRRVEVTTFFCDVRGFTPLAATLEPGEVQRLLDHFYEYIAGAVLDAGGTVMQFGGDEVFAIFGAPLPTTGPVEALAVTQSLLDEREVLLRALRDEGLPDVHFGIGLHVGVVVAAHVGTTRRLQYSAVGDTVNIGSRLCGQAAANTALISEEFWLASGRPAAVPMGALSLKGVVREVHGYRLSPTRATAPAGVP
jgi:adenylate cyclase